MKAKVLCGLDRIETVDALLKGRRVGLITNPTGITRDFVSAIDVIRKRYELTALFACEHGLRGDAQAGDVIPEQIDPETGVTVYSLYGAGHTLTLPMLAAFDILVFDMQDVGARFYTYLYSLANAMIACAGAGKPLVVLDRLNPLGCVKADGTILDGRFASFVGRYALPTQYGLTIGEYALYVRDHLKLDLDLSVVPLSGYRRSYCLDDTDTPWVAPSPNCPTLHAALCYIGTCIFEGSNVSEGRGTSLPFELIGAPWIDAAALEARMAHYRLPGLHFRRTAFVPTFSKHQNTLCHGVQMHVMDREAARPFLGGLCLMDAIRALHPDKFEFLCHEGTYHLDRLLGTDEYRAGGLSAEALAAAHEAGVRAFTEKAGAFRLYD